MVTARCSDQDRIRGYQLGADAYLEKPFNPDELRMRVAKLLDQRQQLRQHFMQELSLAATQAEQAPDDENAIKQSLLSETNRKQKESDLVKQATFILSTIHSAKGLEFDNVVTLYRNETGLDEEKKRMYYVAFTRAMKSEFILAYDVSANPQIEADYFTVLERLHEKYPSANSLITKRNANRVKIKA